MLTKLKLTAIILFFSVTLWAQADYQTEYIEQYKDIAIQEMERAGIPASIKLAQAILESDAGRSKLARKANNHFGIKCGNNWTGKTYEKKDDDYDNRGKLIESCFRSYKKAEESFIAHSEFLRDPSKTFRYGFLFRLDPMDYEKWAQGLKRAGYATSATYDRKLIDIIERFKLYEYDRAVLPNNNPPVVDADEGFTPDPTDPAVPVTRVLVVNDVKMVYAEAGETVEDIARRTDTPVSSILRYNESVMKGDEKLQEGTRVYLQDKRNSYRGRDKWHYVEEGQDMFDISQLYAVDLEKLYDRNNMKFGTEAAVGEKIILRGKRNDTPKLRSEVKAKPVVQEEAPIFGTNEDGQIEMIDPEEEPIAETPQPKIEEPIRLEPRPEPKPEQKEPQLEDPVSIMLPRDGKPTKPTSESSETSSRPTYGTIAEAGAEAHVGAGTSTPSKPTTPSVEAETRMYYEVKRGDTLYSISRRYNTTVDEIKDLNGLSSNTLSIGQQLRVK